ncbi:hypothetical protein HYS29_01485 [Candidatus Microgenomates bacterium]|nr:hypothetical protein [Candidatus Microgenomates bacterium]
MAIKTQNKKRTRQYVDQNPVEAFRDIGSTVGSSIKNDLVGGSMDSLWSQFLGGKTPEQKK